MSSEKTGLETDVEHSRGEGSHRTPLPTQTILTPHQCDTLLQLIVLVTNQVKELENKLQEEHKGAAA